MLHTEAVTIKKIGGIRDDGQYEVMITDAHGNKYMSYMTSEEILLSDLLNTIKDNKLKEDLLDCIEDYAQQKYSEGYDEGEMDGGPAF